MPADAKPSDEEVPAPPPGGGPKPYQPTGAMGGPEMTAGAMGRGPGLPGPGHVGPWPEEGRRPPLQLPGDDVERYEAPDREQAMSEPKDEKTSRKRMEAHPGDTGGENPPGSTDALGTDEAPQPPPTESIMGGGGVAGPGYVAGSKRGEDRTVSSPGYVSRPEPEEDEES